MVSGCRLKEFYVCGIGDDAQEDAILLFASNYDYKKSKFYREDTRLLFDRVLHGAVRIVLAHARVGKYGPATQEQTFSTITRDTFSGAICTVRQKKHLEVDFSSFSHTHELRYVVSDALKYAENALRAYFGIKSRLTVYGMKAELKAALDEYLAQAIPKRAARHEPRENEIPAYEKRYDLPVGALSPERAREIEQSSWETTRRLVEAFSPEAEAREDDKIEGMDRETAPDVIEEAPKILQNEEKSGADRMAPDTVEDGVPEGAPREGGFSLAVGELAELIVLAARGDHAAQRAFARARGMMLDAAIDRINTLAFDYFGDVLLEDVGGGYALIEDYTDMMRTEGILK
jgi:hypothetical protein